MYLNLLLASIGIGRGVWAIIEAPHGWVYYLLLCVAGNIALYLSASSLQDE